MTFYFSPTYISFKSTRDNGIRTQCYPCLCYNLHEYFLNIYNIVDIGIQCNGNFTGDI